MGKVRGHGSGGDAEKKGSGEGFDGEENGGDVPVEGEGFAPAVE